MSSASGVGAHSTANTPIGRGVVTERDACHHAASAWGSKNAASTRVGAALTSTECSNSGDGSSCGAGVMRRSCYSSTLGTRMTTTETQGHEADETWDEHYADERDAS